MNKKQDVSTKKTKTARRGSGKKLSKFANSQVAAGDMTEDNKKTASKAAAAHHRRVERAHRSDRRQGLEDSGRPRQPDHRRHQEINRRPRRRHHGRRRLARPRGQARLRNQRPNHHRLAPRNERPAFNPTCLRCPGGRHGLAPRAPCRGARPLPKASIDGTEPGLRSLGEARLRQRQLRRRHLDLEGRRRPLHRPAGRRDPLARSRTRTSSWSPSGGTSRPAATRASSSGRPRRRSKDLKPGTLPPRRHRGAGARPRLRRAVREDRPARRPTGSPPTATSSPSARRR